MKNNSQNHTPDGERKPLNKEALRYLLILLLNTILFFAVYRVLLYYAEMTQETFGSFVVMVIYMTLILGFVLGYLIYNRFLYRKGVTRDELPLEWTDEQKDAFIEDGERRLKRSKWMMLIIFPLIFTFLIDAIDLFILDTFFR